MGSKNEMRTRTFALKSKSISGSSSTILQPLELGMKRTASDRPNYRTLISQGQSVTNSLVLDRNIVRYRRGRITGIGVSFPYTGNEGYSDYVGLVPNLPDPGFSSSLMTAAVNEATMRILKKIREAQTSLSGPVFLGELRESLQMIKSPAKTLRERTGLFIDRTRKHRRKPGFEKTLADSWLEYSFGAAPLMGDIEAACEAAINSVDPHLTRLRAQSTKVESVQSIAQNAVGGLNFIATYNQDILYVAECKYSCGYWVQGNTDSSSLERLRLASGFNLSEVIPTAWELIPWSFLIDYFTNIGDVLTAASTCTDNVLWWSRTRVSKKMLVVNNGQVRNTAPATNVLGDFSPPTMTSIRLQVVRDGLAPGFPSVTFELPTSNIKFLNMAALIAARRS